MQDDFRRDSENQVYKGLGIHIRQLFFHPAVRYRGVREHESGEEAREGAPTKRGRRHLPINIDRSSQNFEPINPAGNLALACASPQNCIFYFDWILSITVSGMQRYGSVPESCVLICNTTNLTQTHSLESHSLIRARAVSARAAHITCEHLKLKHTTFPAKR